ncbi:MAG: GtrA family protein [Clostridia bacterium]
MKKLVEIIKKVCTKEVILYGAFGLLTTAVNIGTFSLLTYVFHFNENIANAIAIILAVIFAYFTNKDWVFHSGARNLKEKFIEFSKFILGRAFTMFIEYFGCLLLFAICPIPQIISKCIITVIVIILNFFISKFFAFKK